MAYKYITDNNLYEKQNYMYSEYKGMEFIRDYLKIRQDFIQSTEEDISTEAGQESSPTKKALQELLQKLKNGQKDKEITASINRYTKTFEVRKRIYKEYDSRLRPVEDSGFEDYKSYLLLADCLLYAYRYTDCLKYFSCLLKIDDTLLSVQDKLKDEDREYLGYIIRQELGIFYKLADKNGIIVEVEV